MGEILVSIREMTIENLRNELRKEPRTFQAAWSKCGLTDYAKNRIASDAECAKIRAYYAKTHPAHRKEKNVFKKVPPTANKSDARTYEKTEQKEPELPSLSTVRRVLLDIILVGIVVGHAGLIWYDCSDLWDMPGQIGGGLAFFIIVAAVMLATDPAKNITSQIALFFAFLVDFAAWWVHYPVFQTYSVPDEITGVLCAFLCLMSFGALLIYRHQKNN